MQKTYLSERTIPADTFRSYKRKISIRCFLIVDGDTSLRNQLKRLLANCRIDNLKIIEESEISEAALARTGKVSEFTGQAFKMYGGEPESVVLKFEKSLVEEVFDKCGEITPR